MRIAVLLHLFTVSLADEFARYCDNITKAGYHYDIYITIPKGVDYGKLRELWPQSTILAVENKGFDIGPFWLSFDRIRNQPYDVILKLHSKSNDQWRRELIAPILGSPERVRYCLDLLADPTTGLVGSEKWLLTVPSDWGNNKYHIDTLAREWRVPVQSCRFIGGTVFWARHSIFSAACRGLDVPALVRKMNTPDTFDYSWYLMAYPKVARRVGTDPAQLKDYFLNEGDDTVCNCLQARQQGLALPCDAMIEHCYERLFGLIVECSGATLKGVPMASLLSQVKTVCPTTVSLNNLPKLLTTREPICVTWADGRIGRHQLAQLFRRSNYCRSADGRPIIYWSGSLPTGVTEGEFEVVSKLVSLAELPKKYRELAGRSGTVVVAECGTAELREVQRQFA